MSNWVGFVTSVMVLALLFWRAFMNIKRSHRTRSRIFTSSAVIWAVFIVVELAVGGYNKTPGGSTRENAPAPVTGHPPPEEERKKREGEEAGQKLENEQREAKESQEAQKYEYKLHQEERAEEPVH